MFTWNLTPQAPRRRPGRMTVVIIVATALLMVATAYLLSSTHPDARRNGHPTPTAHPATPAPTGHEVDLSGLTWRDFHGIRLPYSRANGPAHTSHTCARGFSDTAGGAVFAAVHIGVRANAQWGPSVFEPTIHHQVDGPDKQALLNQTTSAYENLAAKADIPDGAPIGRAYAVEEAFRVEAFTPQAATVDIVTAGPGDDGTTARAASRIQLTWGHDDWRVLAPPGGDWGATAHTVDDIDGYRPFGDEQGGE